MIELNSFSELRTTTPSIYGEVAFLKSYYDKDPTPRGGGHFVGFTTDTSMKDDNGTVAVGGAFTGNVQSPTLRN